MILLLCLGLLLLSPSALAGSSLGYGSGGQFDRFDPVVSEYNRTGNLFRIEGHCQSACTLFLAIRNVCVAADAILLFHAGHDRSYRIQPAATEHLLSAYNEPLRSYLLEKRAMESLSFHAVDGRSLVSRFGYRACTK